MKCFLPLTHSTLCLILLTIYPAQEYLQMSEACKVLNCEVAHVHSAALCGWPGGVSPNMSCYYRVCFTAGRCPEFVRSFVHTERGARVSKALSVWSLHPHFLTGTFDFLGCCFFFWYFRPERVNQRLSWSQQFLWAASRDPLVRQRKALLGPDVTP